MAQHLRLLRAGEAILKPHYDHKSGDFGPPQYIAPHSFLIVEGLLGMYWREVRNAHSVRVYLDSPQELRWRWKNRRGTAKRGYTKEEGVRELATPEQDSARDIRPPRDHAHVGVFFF